MMTIDISLDDKLVAMAMAAGGHRLAQDAVTSALEEYVQRLMTPQFFAAFGQIDYDEEFSHTAQRNVR